MLYVGYFPNWEQTYSSLVWGIGAFVLRIKRSDALRIPPIHILGINKDFLLNICKRHTEDRRQNVETYNPPHWRPHSIQH